MKKTRVINYEVVKHLFDQNLENEDQSSYFKINGGSEPVIVTMPASIMRRLFRLGQAYNIRQLRYLEPNVKMVIGSVDMEPLVQDLARLKTLVNDEVTHYYADQLLNAINAEAGPARKNIAVSTGEF